ncbi:hypothetical protein L484_027530 [Morus notabilis]|uniref:Uncharacterized protein n=1 Tax=Morus notabilis TaxID=981085 RepID=W9S8W8_9ROSA|nr:hypothetical protein L484_027530 [Morus notabilis]
MKIRIHEHTGPGRVGTTRLGCEKRPKTTVHYDYQMMINGQPKPVSFPLTQATDHEASALAFKVQEWTPPAGHVIPSLAPSMGPTTTIDYSFVQK